jgi:PilZ domain
MQERRASPRQKTLLAGKIVYNNGQVVLDCMVRDMSENGSGARLTFGDLAVVPEEFELHITSKGSIYRAQVKWRKLREIGVVIEKVAAKPGIAELPKPAVTAVDPPKPAAAVEAPNPVVAAVDRPTPVPPAAEPTKAVAASEPPRPVAEAPVP